jgi:tetratricopeptide (TPR) repeat protein
MQVVEKFMPTLAGTDEQAKKGALITIASLSNQDLAIRLGTSYASPGTVEAMEILLKTAKGENEKLLRDALIDAYYSRASNSNNMDNDQIIDDIGKILNLKSIEELKKKWDGYFLADCYQRLGSGYYGIGKYVEAEDSLRKSLEVIPDYSKAYWGLGAVFWERTDSQKSRDVALSYYDLAVIHKADNNILLYRGRLHREMEHLDKALDDFDGYISFRPNDTLGYIEKAKTYKEKGQFGNAKDELRTAIKYARDDFQKADIERLAKDVDNKMKKNIEQISSTLSIFQRRISLIL